MSTALEIPLADHFRRAVLSREVDNLPDGQLLERFVARQDGAAFGVLVRRHGPMVLGVCRRVLGDYHDAEDAFQATFLVLARKAGSVVPRAMVGNWLYGVACRAAAKIRASNLRRRAREMQVAEMPEPVADCPNDLWHELRPLLDSELSLLPHNYRAAVVLCDLEGKTGKDAARQLGWPEGTVSSRLARGRALLAKRLTRRGLAVSTTALATLLARGQARACVPTTLGSSVVNARVLPAAGAGSATAAAAARTVIRALLLAKLKAAAGVLLAAGALALTCGALAGARSDSHAREAGQPVAKAERLRDDGRPEMTDGLITRPGEYRPFDGKLVIKVWEEEGRVRWNATFPGGTEGGKTTLGSADGHIRRGSGWFLFPASAEVIWAYEPDLKRIILTKRRSADDFVMKHADLPAEWKAVLNLERKVPEKVLRKLPAELRPRRESD